MTAVKVYQWALIPLLLLLVGCQGVLELHVERLDAEPTPSLGQIAYIAGGDVWLLDLENGHTTRLTRDGYNRRPRLSADGQWVAYLKGDALHVVNVHETQEMQLSAAGSSDYAWSRQGGRLAYATTDGLAIWVAESQSAQSLPVKMAPLNRLSWHPDGEWLALDNSDSSPRQIIKISADGLHQEILFAASTLMDVPRLAGWSPDGRWLVLWAGSRAPAVEEDGLPLCLIPAMGGELTCRDERVLLWPDYLSWSEAGQLVLIAGGGRETWVGKSLVILEPGNPEPQQLVHVGEQAPIQPAWSPAGSVIAYSAGPVTPLDAAYAQRDQSLQGRHIWLVDIATGRRQQLTGDKDYRDERPVWLADGAYILFARMDNNAASLWLMRSDGSGLRQVVAELTPRPDPLGVYGHVDWGNWWDWTPPLSRASSSATPFEAVVNTQFGFFDHLLENLTCEKQES